MSKQWLAVLSIIAGLGLGAAALVRYRPEPARVAVGARAPEFTALDVNTGDSVSLHERYRGSVTLVNIWATWCGPCRVEMPAMEQAYRDLGPRGFKIAAVSIDEGDPTPVRNFAQELGLTFDILHDPSNRIQQTYQTTGVPESFLLDRQGVIVKRVIGAHDWSAPVNRALVERLLGEGDADAGRGS